ncbi:hypothetical protein AAG906_040238 [Vitis piasezkii]
MCLNFMEPVSKVVGLAGTSFSGQLPTSFINLNSEILPSLQNLTRLNFLQQPEVWVLMESQKAQPWKISVNETVPNFEVLGLASCNLSEFPIIEPFLPWTNLQLLDLTSNLLQESLPVPPSSTSYYFVQNNKLTGNIPLSMCNLSVFQILDLSNNSLSGIIPQHSSKFSSSLSVLNLRGNNFNGNIPQTCINGRSRLKMIDLSENHLEESVPRSLTTCTVLESLNLEDNKIRNTFPFFLGALPE